MKGLQKQIGLRIKELRTRRGDTLEELGKKTNFNYSNLSKIERGERKPTLELLERISEVYDVKVSYFFGEDQSVPENLNDKVDWISFGEEMEKKELTPDLLRDILNVIDKLR